MSDFISNHPDGKSDLHTFTTTPPAPKTTEDRKVPAQSRQEQPLSANDTAYSDYSDHPPAVKPSAQETPSSVTPPYRQFPPSYTVQDSRAYHTYQYAVYGAQQPEEDKSKVGFNIASMVLGIVTWGGIILCCGFFSLPTAILAIIFAVVGRSNGKFDGKGLAGFILGIAFLAFIAIIISILIVHSGTFTSQAAIDRTASILYPYLP